jgi:hypothetical protein
MRKLTETSAAYVSNVKKFAGSNPAEDYGFLREINVCRTRSVGGQVKTSVSYGKILRHFKERYDYERDTLLAKFIGHFLAKFLLLRY